MVNALNQINYIKNNNCKVCNSTEQKIIGIRGNHEYTGADCSKLPHLVTNVVQCKKCQFIYLNPDFKGSDAIEREYYSTKLNYVNNSKSFENTFSYKLKIIEDLDSVKKIADVGSGRGEFVSTLKKEGYDVIGIEPSKGLALESEQTYGVKVINSTLEDCNDSEKFDLITSIHSLEHMSSPHDFIQATKRHLGKNGYLMIEVPNSNATILNLVNFFLTLSGKKWNVKLAPLHPPFHSVAYNIQSLTTLLSFNGYKVIEHFNISGIDRVRPSYNGFSQILGWGKYYLSKLLDRFFEGEILIVLAKLEDR